MIKLKKMWWNLHEYMFFASVRLFLAFCYLFAVLCCFNLKNLPISFILSLPHCHSRIYAYFSLWFVRKGIFERSWKFLLTSRHFFYLRETRISSAIGNFNMISKIAFKWVNYKSWWCWLKDAHLFFVQHLF